MESNELIGILEQLERDKGINKDVLVQAVVVATIPLTTAVQLYYHGR